MKNQNPQDILNEILLRMKYDSKKTLSENKELIYEQATYYYDTNGYLRQQEGPFNLPKGAVLASKAYPNLKPNEYPNYWYSKFLYDQAKTQTQEPKKVSMISPYGYVPTNSTPEGRAAEMQWYSSLYRHNENPKLYANPGKKPTDAEAKLKAQEKNKKPKTLSQLLDEKPSGDNIKEFQDFLDRNYGSWLTTPNYIGKLNQDVTKGYGIFGPNTGKMWDKPEVRSAWKVYKLGQKDKNLVSKSDVLGPTGSYPTSLGINKVSLTDTEKQNLVNAQNFRKEIKKIKEGEWIEITLGKYNTSYETKIPASSELMFWTFEDLQGINSFEKAVTFKSGDKYDFANLFFKTQQNTWFFERYAPIGGIKGFKFKTETIEWEFKQSVEDGAFLRELGMIKDGQYIKWNWTQFKGLSAWEDWGPTILNLGSMALAFLPATWPALLTSAALDIWASSMQYEQGDYEGAKISALLSLTPFIGKALIKVPASVSENLMKKFINAKTTDDVNKVVAGLSKEELDALKSLRELGDLGEEIKKVAKSTEVKKAIDVATKKAPGLAKTALLKGATEVSLSGGVLFTQWDNLKKEVLSNMTNKELIKSYIQVLKKLSTDQNLNQKLSSVESDLENKTVSVVGNKLQEIIETAKKNKQIQLDAIDEEYNKINDYLINSSDSTNTKIGDKNAENLIDPINKIGGKEIKTESVDTK